MIAITIMLAPTVKIFFDKRAEIAALKPTSPPARREQDSLRQQVSRWQDPNYVKQQARDRINMVMPGETGYWVFGSDLPAGTQQQPVRCSSTRPRRSAVGGFPVGVHQACGHRLNRLEEGWPRQWKKTRQLRRRSPASHQHTISKYSAASWDGPSATSWRSRRAASAATRSWPPPRRGWATAHRSPPRST